MIVMTLVLNIGIIIVYLNPLFPSFLHHHCLQILYTTNFLRENVFISCIYIYQQLVPVVGPRSALIAWRHCNVLNVGVSLSALVGGVGLCFQTILRCRLVTSPPLDILSLVKPKCYC